MKEPQSFPEKILEFILFVFGGFVAGVLIWKLLSAGYFTAWTILPSPPSYPVRLITIGNPGIYVMSSDGQIYKEISECTEPQSERCWQIDKVPEKKFQSPFLWPCDFQAVEFSVIASRPNDVADCIQSLITPPDAPSMRLIYALDGSGRVWTWVEPSGMIQFLEMILCPTIGTFLGLLLWSGRRGNASQKYDYWY